MDHTDAGTDPFRTHAPLRHSLGNRLGVFREQVFGWISGNGLYVANPFLCFSHRVLSVDRTGADRRDRKYTLYPRRARVRAALRAASERPLRPLVRAARRADAERSVRVRLRAAERACCEIAFLDAAL